ncbi:CheB methylesterase domain-containing protein [Nitrosophilus kaiyonis]|uniref:CheB methylesterase domain-containing protein n=1 Tax=Nitrosophilus kaiyonis TaxID=2930200 RepID=UPI0024933417|nr:CheB methylesterase domain-containing protein [Nitrosophilus kaiyonis]
MKIVAIGVSTGGPSIIEKIIKSLDKKIDGAIVICLHMQPEIIENFIKRLSSITKIPILITDNFLNIQKGYIYICTAQKDTIYKNDKDEYFILANDNHSFYKPDINRFFLSLAKEKKDIKNTLAVILTGIGEDGVEGLLMLKEKGAKTIASNKESSVVYGMPRRAKELNACDEVLSLDEIIKEIKRFLND